MRNAEFSRAAVRKNKRKPKTNKQTKTQKPVPPLKIRAWLNAERSSSSWNQRTLVT